MDVPLLYISHKPMTFNIILMVVMVTLNEKLLRVKLTNWTWQTLFIVLVMPLQSSPKFMQTFPFRKSF